MLFKCISVNLHSHTVNKLPGVDPGFFIRGGALVSCSTSTPINYIVFSFFAEYQFYYTTACHLTIPLDPPPTSHFSFNNNMY